jgi:hypothetical protein
MMFYEPRDIAGGGGEWCGHFMQPIPRGGKINILNIKILFSALKKL